MNKTVDLKKLKSAKKKPESPAQSFLWSNKNDWDDLKAEIAESAGLILKSFPVLPPELPEPPPAVPAKSKSASFLSTISPNFDQSRFQNLIIKLKTENNSLTRRFKLAQDERASILKQKSLLIREIKKLRGDSDKRDVLTQEIEALENLSKDNDLIFNNLVKEKSALASDYEKALSEISLVKEEAANSARKISELNSSLSILEIEKANLHSDLKKIKQNFNKILTKKTEKIEIQFEAKVQSLRKQKDRVAQFSNEVMEEDTPAWMVTYADMVTLLLTFFILYYSIAAQNVMKFKEVLMGEEKNNIGLIQLLDTMEIRTSMNEWTGFKKNSLSGDIDNINSEQITLEQGPDKSRIVVRIPGRTLFKPGSADLDKAGWPSLTDIANVFKKYPNYKVNIQGHTDDYPISTEDFPTNWELSAVRATAVLRFLNDKGIDPIRMTATGYADMFPLGPNTTDEERSKNRRVEFVLEKIK